MPIQGLPRKKTKLLHRLLLKMATEMRRWVMLRMTKVGMIGNTVSAIASVTVIWLLVTTRAVSWSGSIGAALV
jgi:hypothetical protein